MYESKKPEYIEGLINDYPQGLLIVGGVGKEVSREDRIRMAERNIILQEHTHPTVLPSHQQNRVGIAVSNITPSFLYNLLVGKGCKEDDGIKREITSDLNSRIMVSLKEMRVLVVSKKSIEGMFEIMKEYAQTENCDLLSLSESFESPFRDVEEFFSQVIPVLRIYSQEFSGLHPLYPAYLEQKTKRVQQYLNEHPLVKFFKSIKFD